MFCGVNDDVDDGLNVDREPSEATTIPDGELAGAADIFEVLGVDHASRRTQMGTSRVQLLHPAHLALNPNHHASDEM